MPYKYDDAGNIVTQEVEANGKRIKLPVFVNAKGEESTLDGDVTHATISRLNGEARGHREAKEQAEGKLKVYEGLDDPEAARKALETVRNLDQKKLVDAGEIEKVRNEIKSAFQSQLDAEKKRGDAAETALFNSTIATAFATSTAIKSRFAIPADFVQARFGDRFGIEEGKVYGVDEAGQKIYSQVNPGLVADFDEALMLMVDKHPEKKSFLKGNDSSGGGSGGQGGGAGNGAGNGGKRGDFGGSREDRKAAINARFPELAQSGQ